MVEMGLIIAIKKYIMPEMNVSQLKQEWAKLTDKDKTDLVTAFNENKVLGDDVTVVLSTK